LGLPSAVPGRSLPSRSGLAQRVGVPCCPSARLERDTDAERARRIEVPGTGVNTYSASKKNSAAPTINLSCHESVG
jgi:hypothetical protein